MVSPRRINAQDEQERAFRELINLSKQAKMARQRKIAQEASSYAEQEYRDRIALQQREVAESEAPYKSIFGRRIGKIIPDPIEEPVSEGLKLAYNVFSEVVPELAPWVIKHKILGQEPESEKDNRPQHFLINFSVKTKPMSSMVRILKRILKKLKILLMT